jgi:hypothetical protein
MFHDLQGPYLMQGFQGNHCIYVLYSKKHLKFKK